METHPKPLRSPRPRTPRPWFPALAAAGLLLTIGSHAADEAGFTGMVGVGTWATQAEFKDIRVTRGGRTLFASDFSKGMEGWNTAGGGWEIVDGALRQSGGAEGARALIGDPAWTDYTLTLKARKLGGNEGFLIVFGHPGDDPDLKIWWNLGGWKNTAHGIQAPGVWEQRIPGTIEPDRWYDIRLELEGTTVRAYLDNELIQTATKPTAANAQRDFGRALIPDLIADPSISFFDGVFYLYGTTDGMGRGLETSGPPVVWKSTDFLNWSFSGTIFADNFDAKYWAPSAAVLHDGRYYLFPTLDNRITAVVADAPEGPFRTLDGKDITKDSGWRPMPISVGHPIDAEIFRDDDGTHYMAWSKHFIARLKPDLGGFVGDPVPIPTQRAGYSEGPCIFKRDGIYYYLYTLGGSETYRYAYQTSRTSPLGPWETPADDLIAESNRATGVSGPGHGCFFNLPNSSRWFFVHLEFGRGSTYRHVLADPMVFREDGTIEPIRPTLRGVGALVPNPAYSTPNLALGKAATASSSRPDHRIRPIKDPGLNRIEGFDPANAVDGSNGSRWMAAGKDAEEQFQLDLGEVRDIRRTELYFVTPTLGHAYRLECSDDGETWRTCGGHEDLQVRSPHIDRMPLSTRFLRVTILRGTPGLWEFRVY